MRYLTKSRFKLGTECPTKLFYTKKKEYADQKFDDSFLAQLANGGFQVGELAKYYYPGGVEVEGLDHDTTVAETDEFLKQENVILFEPAIRHENLFMRVDVLRKRGNHFDLIEVKAKSFDSSIEEPFLNKNGTIKAEWIPYLYDVAFQKIVLQRAIPGCSVTAYLLLTDKNSTCPSDGLNQKFRVVKDEKGYKSVITKEITEEDLSERILKEINVDDLCDLIYEGKHTKDPGVGFKQLIDDLADKYVTDTRIARPLSSVCGSCEFQATAEDRAKGLKSGFEECWRDRLGWGDNNFSAPTVLDVWNFRGKNKLLDDGRASIVDMHEDDIKPKDDGKPGVSASKRQWLQIEKACEMDDSCWVDKDNLRREMENWTFPLHFIDFETSQTAIPFKKGQRPYEPVAFQFSHHTVDESGEIAHAGEYLSTEPGKFPNFDFLRELRAQLSNDAGTIFRYAAHENTYLNHIYKQIVKYGDDLADRVELVEFLQSISKSGTSVAADWEGERNMVDMLHLVKRFYYDPFTNGSNSIKQVLPAIMRSSTYLQEKYSKAIYGAEGGIPSLNFPPTAWVVFEGDEIVDPYKLLPKMSFDVSEHDFEILSEDSEINEGGAAMTAYAVMQFEEMSEFERVELRKGLLKYCELDTLAMVMIYEGWREMM